MHGTLTMTDRRVISADAWQRENGRIAALPVVPPFGDLLRRLRAAAGLTQEGLAERAGISVRAISDLERGVNQRPQRETVHLLADALTLAPDEHAAFLAAARQRSAPTPAPARPARAVPHNLPAPVTPLVGRGDDIAAVCGLVRRPEVRLVTVTGFGGIGKTRLSLDAAAALLDDFDDGVFFIPLAAVRETERVVAAIAQTLEIKESPAQPLPAAVIAALRPKRLLLVLDNFEQVIAAAVFVAELLAGCAGLKVLITSRAAAHLRGEHEWPLEPLALPDADAGMDPDALVRSSAVELFVQRAIAVRPRFRLTAANGPAVAAICAALDGLPLAIELAAARTKALPPADLLARLQRRLPLLTDGAYDLPDRHRTMRNAIAWSYDLLHADEQRLFRRLAVFIGGCTLDAIEALCRALDGRDDAVVALVTSLIDKSLVQMEANGHAARYTMLETVREYGAEMLATDAEAGAVRRAHAAYYRSLVEEAEPGLTGAAQERWLAALDAEHANLRAAMQWACTEGQAMHALRIAGAAWRFMEARGHLTEGREWLQAALALESPPGGEEAARAKALNGASMLAYRHGDYDAAARFSEEAIGVARAATDRVALAEALGNFGFVTHIRGDDARALTLLAESLAVAREAADGLSIATALNRTGVIYSYLGDLTRAAACYEESLALHRQRGHRRSIANALDNLGCDLRRMGEYDRAAERSGESLAIFRALGDRWGIANALLNLADIAHDQGASNHALPLYREALAQYHAVGNRLGVVECFEGLGRLSSGMGDHTHAARWFGVGAAQRAGLGTPLPAVDQPTYDAAVSKTRATLGASTFAASWAAGAALKLEQAVADALADGADAQAASS